MTSFFELLSPFMQWLLISSMKATIVAALIMIIRTIFYTKLSSKWLYLLWMLLIIRLIVPFDMSSPFSIFNMTENITDHAVPNPTGLTEEITPAPIQQKSSGSPKISQSMISVNATPQITVKKTRISFYEIAGLVWLLGVATIILFTFNVNIHQWKNLKHAKQIEDKNLIALFQQCKSKLNISKNISLYEITDIQSPFCYGVTNPRILLPSHLLKSFTKKELEHIFLHELAHFKRNDIPLAFLGLFLQAMHWFNPIIWFSFLMMRNDRETACDELVLKKIGEKEFLNYGQTLINLLRHARQSQLVPAALGLANNRSHLKRRINLIANFTHQ